ncbi:MAG: hypothetical protein K1X29_06570 [Bdellovibrionales bacterium]|nr:hypothetical protein [Bdellovibrionales bacterium]
MEQIEYKKSIGYGEAEQAFRQTEKDIVLIVPHIDALSRSIAQKESKEPDPFIRQLRVEGQADRAMFNQDNLDLMDSLGVHYVVAAKLKSMSSEVKQEMLNFASTVDKKGFAVMEKEVEGRRLRKIS